LERFLVFLMWAVKLVRAQVGGGEEVPPSVRTGVGRQSAGSRFAVGVLVSPAAFGPLPPGVRHQIQRSELVYAENDFGLTVLYDLTVGDRVVVLDAALLGHDRGTVTLAALIIWLRT
jgi:hypothetical protein